MNESKDFITLIKLCKRGDARSQSALFDLRKKRWMGICVRYVKDTDEAKDVFQEAAIKIFNDLGTLKELEAFDGWARKIFINYALNHLKRKKVYGLMLEGYGDVMESEKIDMGAVRQMESDEVLSLINQLPDGYRVVLNLALVDGYKHAEISTALSISESTSRSQLTKAKKFLYRLMEEQKIKEDARIAG